MKTTTSFAIKANIAGWLLTFLLTIVLGLALLPLMTNVYFAGSLAIVLGFAGTYFATTALLKNSKLSPEDRAVALERTWQVAVAVGAVLFLADLRSASAAGVIWVTFSVLSIVAQVAAVKVVEARK